MTRTPTYRNLPIDRVTAWLAAMAAIVAFGAVLLHNPAVEAG